MKVPTLALCIPAYNAAAYLPRLLTSAARQTSPFDEIWVYDDCSTDDTYAVATRLGARVVRGARNSGCSAGKNALAERTSCDWIHFHDADDDLRPDFVARAHLHMTDPSCPDVVIFDFEYRKLDTDELITVYRYDGAALRADPIRYAIVEKIVSICGLYRRSAFLSAGGYDLDPAVLYNEDCAFHVRLALAGLRFATDSGPPTIINLRRGGSMSTMNAGRCTTARLALLKKTAAVAPSRVHLDIAVQAWICARNLACYQLHSELATAVKLARSLGLQRPPDEPRWIRALAIIAPVTVFRFRAWAVSIRDRRRSRLLK